MTTPQSERGECTESGNLVEKKVLEAGDLAGQVLASNDSESKKIAAQHCATSPSSQGEAPLDSWAINQTNELYK